MKLAFIWLWIVVASIMPFNAVAQHGGGHGGHGPEPEPPPEPVPPTDDEVRWETDDISKAFKIASKEKKLVFMYFYFTEKDDFPSKYDRKLREYGEIKIVFTKFFVRTTAKGAITNERISEIFANYNLPKKSIGLVFDQFGSLLDRIMPPVNAGALISCFDRADKKIKDIEKYLAKQWEKVEEFKKKESRAEMVKELNKIIKTGWQGYAVFLNAQAELDAVNSQFIEKHNTIVGEYFKQDEKKRDKDAIIARLQDLLSESEGSPAETIIKDTIEKVTKGTLSKPEEDNQTSPKEERKENEKKSEEKNDGEDGPEKSDK